MSDLKVPIISVIIGEGGSGGALALAVADEVWMLEHTIYAVLLPEGFASILWKDGRAKEAAMMKITATELKELAIVDKVIPEVMNGQPLEQAKNRMLQKAFISKLTELAKLDTETLLEKDTNVFANIRSYTHRTFQGLMGGLFFFLFYLFFYKERPSIEIFSKMQHNTIGRD